MARKKRSCSAELAKTKRQLRAAEKLLQECEVFVGDAARRADERIKRVAREIRRDLKKIRRMA